VFAGLVGRILDAGAGTGANLPFYPAGAEVHGIDVSRKMLDRAAARATRAGRTVSFSVNDLCRTPFPDRHFDAVVSTFVFCVLDDAQQLPALSELARICRKDGEIRLIDYRMSQHPVGAAAMKGLSRWSGWLFDCRYQPTTDDHIEAAGLEIVDSRFVIGDIVKLLILRPRG
jgi:ubiquinone/menaquinone biosynthesis C-methylase UbiE